MGMANLHSYPARSRTCAPALGTYGFSLLQYGEPFRPHGEPVEPCGLVPTLRQAQGEGRGFF